MTATLAPSAPTRWAIVSPVIPAPTTATSTRGGRSRGAAPAPSLVPTQSDGFASCRLPMREPYPDTRRPLALGVLKLAADLAQPGFAEALPSLGQHLGLFLLHVVLDVLLELGHELTEMF